MGASQGDEKLGESGHLRIKMGEIPLVWGQCLVVFLTAPRHAHSHPEFSGQPLAIKTENIDINI